MSSDNNSGADAEAADMMYCASCFKSEVDDVKLMDCADCKSVRYCSDNCREDHRPQHEAKCKERVAELRDEILFRQPESTHLGDCPICCLRFQLTEPLKTKCNLAALKLYAKGVLTPMRNA